MLVRSLFSVVILLSGITATTFAYSDTPAPQSTTTLVPKLQILEQGGVSADVAGFTEPVVFDTFPAGTIRSARYVTTNGDPFWVFGIYRWRQNTTHPDTIELCFRFDETNTVSQIGTLGYGDIMMNNPTSSLSCQLSSTEGVYVVNDYTSANSLAPAYYGANTLVPWKFLIFWEEE